MNERLRPSAKNLSGEAGGPSASPLLVRQATQSSAWVVGARLLERGLRTVRTIVLARLLSPTDIGLFAIAVVALGVLEQLSALGLDAALLRKRGGVEGYLDLAWTVQMVRGLVLGIALLFFAPLVAAFFDEPAAIPLVRVVALSAVIRGGMSIGLLQLQRDVDFVRITVWQFAAAVADLVVSVAAAFVYRDAWALVWGGIASSTVLLVSSYIVAPGWPRIAWNTRKFFELLRFGRWVFLTGLFDSAVRNGDYLIVGRFLGTAALGVYQVAFMIAEMAGTEVVRLVMRVGFPFLARLQDSEEDLRKALLVVTKLVCAVSIPMAAGTAILASDITSVLLGDEWVEMVPPLVILCGAAFARVILEINGSVLMVFDRPEVNTGLRALRAVVMIGLIFCFLPRWGLAGAAWAVVLSITLFEAVPGIFFVSRYVRDTWSLLASALFPPIVGSFGMVGVLWMVRDRVPVDGALVLTGLVLLGCVSYGIFMVYLDTRFDLGLVRALRVHILPALRAGKKDR